METEEAAAERTTVVRLRPTTPTAEDEKHDRKPKVVWAEDTVDNENMNKKKSKCCCIYEKPHKFDESSSSSSDDEVDHCFGHVEKKKKKRAHAHGREHERAPAERPPGPPPATEVQAPAGVEAAVAVTLQPTDAPPGNPPANLTQELQATILTATTQAGNIAETPQVDNLPETSQRHIQDGGQQAKRNSLPTAKTSTSDTGKPRKSNTPVRKSGNAKSPDKQKQPRPP